MAEDYEINQVVVREFLRRFGLECDVVSDGVAALKKSLTKEYDLVLLDCQMPLMDGLQVATEVRKTESSGIGLSRLGGRLPLIALTANAIAGDREMCLEAGMDDYLTKPITCQSLTEMLLRWLPIPQARAAVRPLPETSRNSIGSASIQGPFDEELLLNQCFGDVELAVELLNMFELRGEQSLHDMRAAVRNDDRVAVFQLSHGVKGVAANLCAGTLSRSAGTLERRSSDETVELVTLREEIDTFCEDLRFCLNVLPQVRQKLQSLACTAGSHDLSDWLLIG